MTIKEFWSKTSGWVRARKPSKLRDYQPEIDNEGLISADAESAEPAVDESVHAGTQSSQVVVKTLEPTKKEPLEKVQEGFNKLVGQLQDINEHLGRQITQHEDLMSRIEQLPKLLESFPAVVENQKQMIEQMLEQLKTTAGKDQQFIDSVRRIPTETAKQTDALANIDHQLAAAADADVQMAESFNKFNETLDKLNQSTVGQTDSVLQMSRTFATSDRYLKYLMSRQNKRFMWIFVTAIGVCVLAILILAGIVIYLRQ